MLLYPWNELHASNSEMRSCQSRKAQAEKKTASAQVKAHQLISNQAVNEKLQERTQPEIASV